MAGIVTLQTVNDTKTYLKTIEYLDFISQKSGIKIDIVSVGPKRKQTFYVQH